MITVIDLEISNIASVCKALKKIGAEYKVVNSAQEVLVAEKIILPGVGSFYEGMKRIRSLGLEEAIKKAALEKNRLILGICLGMQLLAESGEEGQETQGLGLVKASVSYHRAAKENLSLPHIGWNDVNPDNVALFDSIPHGSCFYFIHSYEFVPAEEIKVAYCNYGVDFVAAFQKDNIFGVQFHAEKSQKVGLKLLTNFCKKN